MAQDLNGTFTFPIDHETRRALEKVAAELDRPKAWVIRYLIRQEARQLEHKTGAAERLELASEGVA